jgi:hypothetical protein
LQKKVINSVKKCPKNVNFKTIGQNFYHPKNSHFLTKILNPFLLSNQHSFSTTIFKISCFFRICYEDSGFTKRFPFICPKSSLGQKWSFLSTKIPITLQISILWCCKHHFHIPCLIFNILKKKGKNFVKF